jgi:hypothetical protein
MLPATTARVIEQTPDYINDRILQKTEENIARYSAAGPEAIRQRLAELDREWDIERFLEVNASIVSLTGFAFGILRNRRWLILPIAVGAFLLQHALQGWCPPVSVFRRLGIRTSAEIEHERYALKALRGDFRNLEIPGTTSGQLAHQTLEAVRA